MNDNKKIKIAVGMSGGVDSSVAAKILVDQGYTVIGFMMKFWSDAACGASRDNACCDPKSMEDAKRVAEEIGIPFYVIDAREKFKTDVVDYFIDEYKNLRTPNPCVVCNKKIKFGWFLNFAKSLDCDFVATGHYARIVNDSSELKVKGRKSKVEKRTIYKLLKGLDSRKDQSYFLHQLDQGQLSHVLLPVGGYTKDQVRAMAKEWKLPVGEKKESQEVCFIMNGDYRQFLKRQISDKYFKGGEIVDTEGNIIGKHEGLINYTIGQRKGIEQVGGRWTVVHGQREEKLSINNQQPTINRLNKKPMYVVDLDVKSNRLIVGESENTYRKEMDVKDLRWIQSIDSDKFKDLSVKIRYRTEAVPCTMRQNEETARKQDSRLRGNDKKEAGHETLLVVEFHEPQRAITPGQSAVFYDGDEVLGGGIIC